MAPVETRMIEFPIRKPRTRSTKSKLIEVEEQPKSQKPITRSPLKQVKSSKPSPLKSAPCLSPSKSKPATPHRVRLHFNENEENANPNAKVEIVTKVTPKKLEKLYQNNESPKLISPSSKSTPVTPFRNLNLQKSPVKGIPRSPRKALFTPPASDRILRSPQKKLLSVPIEKGEHGENKNQDEPIPIKSPRKTVKLGEQSLFRADVSHLVEAKIALSTALPLEQTGLVGRQKQLDLLKDFLKRNLALNEGKKTKGKRSIYISGPPGTGKTTCLKHLIKTLPSDSELTGKGKDKTIQEPHCIFINCMAVKNGNAIYEKIAENLSSVCAFKSDSIDPAKKTLEEAISGNQLSSKILLVLDEIDQLDSKCNEVLYSLFEWPYLRNSKLVLVGIANSLDLTDRILPRLKVRLKAVCINDFKTGIIIR